MKKNITKIAFLFILVFILNGCQKENTNISEIDLLGQKVEMSNFKYIYEVVIESENKEHFVTYKISSNNNDVAKSMVNRLENSTIRLITQETSLESFNSNTQVNSENEAFSKSFDPNKMIYVEEIASNMGEIKEFQIVESKSSLKTIGFDSGFSAIAYSLNANLNIGVANLWNHPFINFHYNGNPGIGYSLNDIRILNPFNAIDYLTPGVDHLLIVIAANDDTSDSILLWNISR